MTVRFHILYHENGCDFSPFSVSAIFVAKYEAIVLKFLDKQSGILYNKYIYVEIYITFEVIE